MRLFVITWSLILIVCLATDPSPSALLSIGSGLQSDSILQKVRLHIRLPLVTLTINDHKDFFTYSSHVKLEPGPFYSTIENQTVQVMIIPLSGRKRDTSEGAAS